MIMIISCLILNISSPFIIHLRAAELVAKSFPRSIDAVTDNGDTILHICAINNRVEVMKVVTSVKVIY